MKNIKEKLPMVFLIIILLIVCVAAIYFIEIREDVYYTQIDNSKLQKLSTTDDMKYQYTLDCYKGSGKKKELSFKTSRELREDAYLMLEVRSIGVHSWKEVKYEELPEKVKVIYNK